MLIRQFGHKNCSDKPGKIMLTFPGEVIKTLQFEGYAYALHTCQRASTFSGFMQHFHRSDGLPSTTRKIRKYKKKLILFIIQQNSDWIMETKS